MLGRRTGVWTVVVMLVMLGVSGCGFFVKRVPPGEIGNPTPLAQDHFIKVGEVNYHYAEYPAQGADIVMVHGFASSTYSWEQVAPALQKSGYHVWTLDMKGFGWSDKPQGQAYDAFTLMQEVKAWMDAVGLRKVIYVGNSLGGAVGTLLALEYPERVERMILIDPAGYQQKKPLIIRMAGIPGSIGVTKAFFGRWMVSWNLKEVFYHKDWVTPERIEAYYARLCTSGALDAQGAVIKGLDFDAFEKYIRRIPDITTPTLLIWGQNDIWIPLENGHRYRRDLKSSRLAVIPECGHVPQEEFPDLTAKLILEFLGGSLDEDIVLPGGKM